MYIDYFCLNRPISDLIKSVKDEGLTNLGSEMHYVDKLYGDIYLKCEYVDVENGCVTLIKNRKGKILTYPLKGKFFVGKHNKGFYDSIAIFGFDGQSKNIVLDDDYSTLMPMLMRFPKTADEILELVICDPRYIKYVDIKYLKPILEADSTFLKHLKPVVQNSVERILSNKIENLTEKENKMIEKLKKRYRKEVAFWWNELVREVKHSSILTKWKLQILKRFNL